MIKSVFRDAKLEVADVAVSTVVEGLKAQARIERDETCFAGKGKMCSKSLTASPSDAKKLRQQAYW